MDFVRSGAFRNLESLTRELGGNPVRLIRAVGLSPAQFRDPDTQLSYSTMAELMERAARACKEPLFGVLLASRQSATVLGELMTILGQQPTVGDALDSVERYLFLHARGVHVHQLVRGDTLHLRLVFDFTSPLGLNQLIQLSVGHLAHFLAGILRIEARRLSVFLRQDSPEREARRGRPLWKVGFGAGEDAVRIPVSWLKRAAHTDQAAVRQHFHDYVERLRQQHPHRLQDQVREIVLTLLPSGECCIKRVAATLHLHPRVLQKTLRLQGSSYSAVLQSVRRDIAEQHLRDRRVKVTDLALNLGYADVATFSRNFRQWTGCSPRQWRERSLGAPAGAA